MFEDIIDTDIELTSQELVDLVRERFYSLNKQDQDGLSEEVEIAIDHFEKMHDRKATEAESLAITGEVLRKNLL